MDMKMTYLEAMSILMLTGDEDRAWRKAKEDDGLRKDITKEEWLKFAYSKIKIRRYYHG